jgi:hypothetical protein
LGFESCGAAAELTGLSFRIAVLFALSALVSFSQTPVPAGGRWVRIEKRDSKTGAQFVTFAVEADADISDRRPAISITCSDRLKTPQVLYFADSTIDPQIHNPMNYYAPALYSWIKIDKNKLYRAVWDIAPGASSPRLAKTAVVDRKTARALLKGTTMKVRYEGHLGQELIDSFTIGGLDKEMVRDACGSKWFGKD